MIGWLLDTNIPSELRRIKPEPQVIAFVAAQPLERLFISVVTLADIRFGIERIGDARRRPDSKIIRPPRRVAAGEVMASTRLKPSSFDQDERRPNSRIAE